MHDSAGGHGVSRKLTEKSKAAVEGPGGSEGRIWVYASALAAAGFLDLLSRTSLLRSERSLRNDFDSM
jgi:hypothetical protein